MSFRLSRAVVRILTRAVPRVLPRRCVLPRMLIALAMVSAAGAVATAPGCAADGAGGRDARPRQISTSDPRWPYWPADFRLHPLTRLVTDADGQPLWIEARVEFLDPEGHTTKACGELRLELRDASVRTDAEPLVWERMDLGELEFNRTYFDEVTRTYVFRLELMEGQALPERPLLRAYYLSALGQPFDPREFSVRVR